MESGDDLSRRKFLQAGGALAALALAGDKLFALQPPESAPLPQAELEGPLGHMVCSAPQAASFIGGPGTKYSIRNNLFYLYDMDRKTHRELEIPIGLSHDTHLHPVMKDQALVIEREGPYACLVDFRSMKVIRRISASPDHYLTGHGTYTPDGEFLYLAQYPKGRFDISNVLVLETKDYKPVRTIDTGGSAPHEFSWFPDGKRVAIGHYGLPTYFERKNLRSMVAIYDREKDEVVEELRSPLPNLYLCHVKVTRDDRLMILTHDSLWKPGPESEKIRKIKMDYERYVKLRPHYFDFSLHPSPLLSTTDFKAAAKGNYQVDHTEDGYRWGLSLTLNEEHKVAGGTHGFGGVLTFQSTETGKLIGGHKFKDENPRGLLVTLNKKYFAVTSDKGNLHYFDAKTRELVRTEALRKGRYDHVVHAQCVDLKA